MRFAVFAIVMLGSAITPATAEDYPFADGPDGSKVHVSGYICPAKIGAFERDAAGLRDPETQAGYCAYSALSGVYGTVVIQPLPANADSTTVLAPGLRTLEATGGKILGEGDHVQMIGPPGAVLPVTVRIYETARLDTRRYRVLFASAPVGAFAVAAIVEYSDPADKDLNTIFLNAIYGEAKKALAPAP